MRNFWLKNISSLADTPWSTSDGYCYFRKNRFTAVAVLGLPEASLAREHTCRHKLQDISVFYWTTLPEQKLARSWSITHR